MQCSRCGSVVADTTPVCPACGNALASVDSYGATSFAPVMPSPQPAAHVSVRSGTAQLDAFSAASTMMAQSSPVPPTMISNTPNPNQSPNPHAAASPRYVVTPAHGSAQPPPPQPSRMPTMQSAAPAPPTPQPAPMAQMAQYAPPPQPLQYGPPYPMMMPQQMPMQSQGTPGMAVASLICGLLGLVPFWIGFILCLLAITFGGIVMGQTRPGQPGRGLALTGLIFGLVFLLPAACGL